jgi:hypothetical protein
MEQIAKQQGGRLSQYDLTTQEALWLQVKHLEAANDPI